MGHRQICPDCRREQREEKESKKVCIDCGTKTRGRLRICQDCRKKRKTKSYGGGFHEDISKRSHLNFSHRSGSFLERTIANLFEKVGFSIDLNSKEFGFETDIIARRGKFTIIIEAKQYDHSYINIGSLLHEWSSKSIKSGADRVLVIIAGINIPYKFYELAEELGVYLWDEKDINELNGSDTKEEVYRKICLKLDFGEIMKRFEEIENANLSENQKFYFEKEAIKLSNFDFRLKLNDLIKEKNDLDEKNKKETERLIKEHEQEERLFKENLEKEKRKQKKWRMMKVTFKIILIIIASLVIFIFIKSLFNIHDTKDTNSTLTNINKNLTPSILKSSDDILKEKCLMQFSGLGIYNIRNIGVLHNEQEMISWLNEYINSSYLTEEGVQNRINFTMKKKLVSAEYPVVALNGDERINPQVVSHGERFCNNNGIL